MPNHDHSDAANNAIADTITDRRPSVTESWLTLKPTLSPLNLGHGDQCMDFFGKIVASYNVAIAPCSCASADTFEGLQAKTLITLRDAMLEATTCV